ncbi:MAG: sugar ABC transporter permease [Chloroflexi bacterium]|nr:sugar ABC transporter permease [Chloroflexota bacterium]
MPRKRNHSSMARKEFWAGLLFGLPWILGVLIFLAYPMVASFYFSFTQYDMPKPPRWVGLDNYVRLFSDRFFPQALWNSFYLTIFGIPIQLAFALFCAMLLDLKVKGQAVWRTIYVLPNLMPPVVMAILWNWILNPRLGLVNNMLASVGIKGPLWFASPAWSKPSMILMLTWGVGFMTILYLAALQGVPQELYEAAEIDGAGRMRKFMNITFPMISSVTLFQLVTGIIWSLGFFTQAYLIGGGGSNPGAPQGSLLFYGLYLYIQAFEYLRMGYASALAWIFFLITALVTLIIMRTSRRWTYYDVV